jgi:hypothetical protein
MPGLFAAKRIRIAAKNGCRRRPRWTGIAVGSGRPCFAAQHSDRARGTIAAHGPPMRATRPARRPCPVHPLEGRHGDPNTLPNWIRRARVVMHPSARRAASLVLTPHRTTQTRKGSRGLRGHRSQSGRGRPPSSTATIVNSASVTFNRSPPIRCGSVHVSMPNTIEVRPVRRRCA